LLTGFVGETVREKTNDEARLYPKTGIHLTPVYKKWLALPSPILVTNKKPAPHCATPVCVRVNENSYG
jgi:hypothetical protein